MSLRPGKMLEVVFACWKAKKGRKARHKDRKISLKIVENLMNFSFGLRRGKRASRAAKTLSQSVQGFLCWAQTNFRCFPPSRTFFCLFCISAIKKAFRVKLRTEINRLSQANSLSVEAFNRVYVVLQNGMTKSGVLVMKAFFLVSKTEENITFSDIFQYISLKIYLSNNFIMYIVSKWHMLRLEFELWNLFLIVIH